MNHDDLRKYLIDPISKPMNNAKLTQNEIEARIESSIEKYNHSSLTDFDGLSPDQMHQLLNYPLGKSSPISFKVMTVEQYRSVPLVRMVKWLLEYIESNGHITLTQKGNLPVKVVKELYAQKFKPYFAVEMGMYSVHNEENIEPIHLARIILEKTGFVRKQHGKLYITKSRSHLIKDDKVIFEIVFIMFVDSFNWAYLDGYQSDRTAQYGWAYSVYLLLKYGSNKQFREFYAEKYLTAFPLLIQEFDRSYTSPKDLAVSAYCIRTFDRFMDYFGLIDLEKSGLSSLRNEYYVKKTKLFDAMFKLN